MVGDVDLKGVVEWVGKSEDTETTKDPDLREDTWKEAPVEDE